MLQSRKLSWFLIAVLGCAAGVLFLGASILGTHQTAGCANSKECPAALFKLELPPVPRTWDEKQVESLEIPVSNLIGAKKQHVTADYYYRIPVRPLYKSYPVYAPGRAPQGYKEWLQKQQPELIFDITKLHSYEDWVNAGRELFRTPIAYNALVDDNDLHNSKWFEAVRPPVARDGTVPFLRYGIREGGRVEVGILSCATCHSRVMPDGQVIDGAQGNFRYNAAIAWSYRMHSPPEFVHKDVKLIYGTPWMNPDPHGKLYTASVDEICSFEEVMPNGVIARNGTSPFYPTQVPSLIGVKDRLYLDATGQIQHRNIADLMRYMALAQGIDFVSNYDGFVPNAEGTPPKPPAPSELRAQRYSDEELFALALYIYSLKPPANPNKDSELAAKGKQVFLAQGCDQCHTPPLYTNNKLMPVEGFEVPSSYRRDYQISDMTIGTDPGLTLKTRRGTGFYKVPSLKGLWYREMLGHSGYIRTLEDWFNPQRLRPDYVPSGFHRPDEQGFAVGGHPYGLSLSESDRAALIAFLRTLD
jgi:hypothetical protein